jgi:malate/lactate dehydrogenase
MAIITRLTYGIILIFIFGYQLTFSYRVTIAGACGPVGKPLSLLLRPHKYIKELLIHDTSPITSLLNDLNEIYSSNKIIGFEGAKTLGESLHNSDIVIVPSSIPRNPELSKATFFQQTASITSTIANECALNCPNAIFLILGSPLDMTVPIFSETLKKHNIYDKRKVIGIMTPEIMIAQNHISQYLNISVDRISKIPVIGGHRKGNLSPLLSQIQFHDENQNIDSNINTMEYMNKINTMSEKEQNDLILSYIRVSLIVLPLSLTYYFHITYYMHVYFYI